MPYFILGLALLVGGLLLVQWFVKADPKTAARAVKALAAVVGVSGLLLLFWTKAWQWLPALAITLLPWMRQWRAVQNIHKAARGPTGGGRSNVRTDYLDMELDHDSGEMFGTVRTGEFAGRTLNALTLDDLLALLAECHGPDPQSAAVLAAYLDRAYPDWRERAGEAGRRAGQGAPPPSGGMTVEEARQVLGVGEDAGDDEIKAAHRQLIKQFHPDQGGSSYLAAKINEAKDILLNL